MESTKDEIKWYNWDGTFQMRHILEINMKRNEYDAFQNESCKAITKSRIGCNTNLAVVFPGPIAGYVFKYQVKDTQEDDTEQYQRVSDMTQKAMETRKHDSDNKEALRRILSTAFAHQKKE